MYVYVCMHACMYVCMYVCDFSSLCNTHPCMCICVCMYIYICMYMHACMYVCLYVCMYACMCMYVCIYVCIYTHIHAHIHIYIHICICNTCLICSSLLCISVCASSSALAPSCTCMYTHGLCMYSRIHVFYIVHTYYCNLQNKWESLQRSCHLSSGVKTLERPLEIFFLRG